MSRVRRFAVLWCEDAPKWKGYESTIEKALAVAEEKWEIFDVAHDSFPEAKSLRDYDAVLISGSHYSADGNEPFIEKLREFLRNNWGRYVETLDESECPTKLFGICFGHQIIAHALGGFTGRNPSKKRIFRNEVLIPSPAFYELPYLAPDSPLVTDRRHVRLLCCHCDQVLRLPTNAKALAWSEDTEFEMYAVGNRILGTQSHPEFSMEEMTVIRPTLKDVTSTDPDDCFVRESVAEGTDNGPVREFIRAFLLQ